MRSAAAGLILFLGLFGFYLSSAAPSVTTGDSGEFITAAATLSLPHAPSYPVYMLAGKSFIAAMPFGSAAYRCNVFSAFTSAATGALLFFVGTALGAGAVVSALTVLLIGVSASFWENSLVTEVFSLNILFAAGLLLCLVKKEWFLAAFLFGLGMGNHQILLFVFPAFLAFVIPAKAGIQSVSISFKDGFKIWIPAFAGMTGVFLIGFSVYLVLPIRSAKEPPLNWGQPTTAYRLYRTIARKDYGSLKLAVGDVPARNAANAARHMKTFVKHMAREIPWPIALLMGAGLVWGMARRDRFAYGAAALFVASGPFFFWLGNLPFTAQSDGIVGRFMMLPMTALLLTPLFAFRERRGIVAAVLAVAVIVTFQKNHAQAQGYRSSFMPLDYGRAMMRTLPMNAALFMDGGDDAFYTTAMLRYAMGKRPDVALHDRGGLVFRNPYGGDFRSLPKEEKPKRRAQVEMSALQQRPVYYSTMDSNVLPGVQTKQDGFLEAARGDVEAYKQWKLILLRSLHPLKPDVYRMRALGAFFPYMRGRELIKGGNVEAALREFNQALRLGYDVEWLSNNLSSDYARAGYDFLVRERFDLSESVYRAWLAWEPKNMQANSNYGVVLERLGRTEEAIAQYEKTARLFPDAADPVFNLSVLAWKAGDWPRVIDHLEEVLRRKPEHPQARGYLNAAKGKIKSP